ncbi:metal-dependent hydrolase [Vibrio sp. RE86]|uniref:metal-dependent hydrolase n=1 Tax=Vibrio sp. RE86 TaxID=2607605 RepID=UPI0014937E3B|nr:metal-dependent hydrolase [Vibrio sp. RE86]NOH78593.1 metal-dependent hydrolase [Vibrio sp. RE86]
MDPITQGLLGAAVPQSVGKKPHMIVAGGLGLLAAMTPDLDVLIRSSTDPLLLLQFHRQFTHSLLFIPFGSLLCALMLHPLFGKRCGLPFKQSWLYCALGFGTHGLLDACTSYGTQLLWPLSDNRYAWNSISVVDPAFTIPILVLLLFATIKRKPWLSRVALVWALAYLVLGSVQRDRALQAGWQLAEERQHEPIRLFAKPTFANVLLWKVVYETEQSFYIDAVRAGSAIMVYPGESIAKLDVSRDFPWLDLDSQQAQDIERFRHFSSDFLAQGLEDKQRIMDVRYSMIPNQIDPLWSIRLSPSASETSHVEYHTHRDNSPQSRQQFFDMLLGR